MLVKELKTIAPLYWVYYWKTIPCSRNALAFSPDYVVFRHSSVCVVQCWGITLSFPFIWKGYIIFLRSSNPQLLNRHKCPWIKCFLFYPVKGQNTKLRPGLVQIQNTFLLFRKYYQFFLVPCTCNIQMKYWNVEDLFTLRNDLIENVEGQVR